MREIDDDTAAGALARRVRGRTGLHDYVDANDYPQGRRRRLVKDLVETMRDEGGAGLAVQQHPGRRRHHRRRSRRGEPALGEPERPDCAHGTYAYRRHDRTTAVGADGEDLDEPITLRFGHCHLPVHDDQKIHRHR